jgi:hypothetical protein
MCRIHLKTTHPPRGVFLGLVLFIELPGASYQVEFKNTPKNEEKGMSNMIYKTNEKIFCSFFWYFFSLRFWMFLCMGSSKTPKNVSRKISENLKKAPTHLRGRFFFFPAPLGGVPPGLYQSPSPKNGVFLAFN